MKAAIKKEVMGMYSCQNVTNTYMALSSLKGGTEKSPVLIKNLRLAGLVRNKCHCL
jgi:hypothetical protein